MLIIIDQYKEKVNLAASHGQMLRDKQAKVSALRVKREAREEVMELLHKEGMKWMDRFALTLNESQELPKLLAKAKTVVDTYSAPDEVHSLFNYCQHMVELMTHIIRNR